MKLKKSISDFRKKHKKKQNQIIFHYTKCKNSKIIENIINNFLNKKNSFIFESVEKQRTKGRYTILGFNPDKIWEFNQNKIYLIENKKKKLIKKKPYFYLKNLIENFKFPLPPNLPPLSSLLVGYFSYDIIRYIEKVPNNCIDDLKIPDVRLMRPKTIIIYDNLVKKIFFIINCFADEKIKDYSKYYVQQVENLKNLKNITFNKRFIKTVSQQKKRKVRVKSNISKKRFKEMVIKAKKYIKKGDIFQVVLSQRFESKL